MDGGEIVLPDGVVDVMAEWAPMAQYRRPDPVQ